MSNYYRKDFDSISAMARFIDSNPRHPECRAGSSSESRAPRDGWDNNVGFEGALSMAAAGGRWPEGAKNLLETHVEMTALKNEGRVNAEDYDVTGHTLDIGSYLAGLPDCFINDGDEDENIRPIIRIGVQIGRSALVGSTSVLRRGSAILSVIDDLEAQGFRVELTALWANQDPIGGDMGDVRVVVKEAQDIWSADSVAFAICHASFNRRLTWRVIETQENMSGLTNGGYGRGVLASHCKVKGEYDVFLPWQTKDYYSASAAMTDINQQVTEQLEIDQ